MKRAFAVAALTGLLALAACDRPAKTPEAPTAAKAAAFKHDLPEDVSGYYLPTEEVRVDNWRLHHVFMGQVPDFIAWEGGQHPAGFAPVMIDQGALATARRNLGDRGVVLTGTLKVGNRTFNKVSMRWWAGD